MAVASAVPVGAEAVFPLRVLVALIMTGGALGGCAQFFIGLVPWSVEPPAQRAAGGAGSVSIAVSGGADKTATPLSGRQFCALTAMAIMVGIAGAAGLTGIFALLKVFDERVLDGSRAVLLHSGLAIAGVSTVGGFAARRMLPLLGDNLARKVSEIQREVTKEAMITAQQRDELARYRAQLERAEIEGMEAQRKLTELNHRAIIDGAFITLGAKSAKRWQQAKDELMRLRGQHPEDREATILAARFLTERLPDDSTEPDFHGAIKILDDYLNREKTLDSDVSDILINRACYYVKLRETSEDAADKEKWRTAALEDLGRCFRLKEANKIFAIGDEDLKPLRADPDFLALVAPHKPPDETPGAVPK